jgi:DNA-binding GntR family transcriptional regulator
MRPFNRSLSLASIAAERIRDAIIAGDLKLGEALSEDRLATTLGISRTPVREALTSLQVQGLITIQPQRGSFVFRPTGQDVQELCEFRAMAESRAMWLAHARNRDATLADLRAAQTTMDAAVASGDDRATSKADAAFHDCFFQWCGNRFLAEAYSVMAGRISAIRSLLLNPPATRARTVSDHYRIIEAFEAANLPEADAMLGMHIMKMRTEYETAVASTA